MKLSKYLQNFKPDQVCTVNGNKVWDYKDVEDFSRIYLISEPVKGSENFEEVTAKELQEFVGVFAETAEVFDETTGELVESI